mmetsp:Transcript_38151/g.105117  ORF Transcript_38151/g.105117 Transcript_38151/m.105117 type:complete len:561 (-) Transcript_38151:162-1844(-)
MPVQFKFRGEKVFRGLLNVTTPCTLQRVKNAIYEQARISDQSTDLELEDAATGVAIDPRTLLVQDSLVQVVVRRTPVQSRPAASLAIMAPLDDTAEKLEEELAIDRVVEQHDLNGTTCIVPAASGPLLRYSRSYRLAVSGRARQREGYDLGGSDEEDLLEAQEPPPPNYTCHRCGTVGGKPESHWIWECPTNEDPDHMRKVLTAKGVPRQFLKKVATIEEGQEQSAGGVTFTLPGHSGHYIISHEASYEEKKLRVGDTVQEKVTTAFSEGARRVEESLKCPLCHQLFRQAVLAPCCGATFCSDCVVDRLAHSSIEQSCCPGCGREVLAHQLVANEDIRKQVEQIARASKAAAVATQKIAERPKIFEVDAALKDRVNRPRKHAAEEAAAASSTGAAPLAILDGSTGAAPPPAPAQWPGPNWAPLGFGPMLRAEDFAAWQKAARSGAVPAHAKEQFADLQRRMREAMPAPTPAPAGAAAATVVPAAPALSAASAAPAAAAAAAPGASLLAPPSKESFEEWQRSLREGKRAPPAGLLPAEEKREKRDRKERKEKRMKVMPEDL